MAERIASLTIVRSGGVAGLTRRRSVAAGALTARQRRALTTLAASPQAAPARGADRFSFALTLAYESGATQEITVAEDAVPPALADVIR